MCMQDFQIGQRIAARTSEARCDLGNFSHTVAADPNRVGFSINVSQNAAVRLYSNTLSGYPFAIIAGSTTNRHYYFSIKDYGQCITNQIIIEDQAEGVQYYTEYYTERHLSELIQGTIK